jgi:ammonia channel protein AmtB
LHYLTKLPNFWIHVLVMQAGFAFLEAGAARSKNTTNVLMKNLLEACKNIFI